MEAMLTVKQHIITGKQWSRHVRRTHTHTKRRFGSSVRNAISLCGVFVCARAKHIPQSSVEPPQKQYVAAVLGCSVCRAQMQRIFALPLQIICGAGV